jgi:hypothetical protein
VLNAVSARPVGEDLDFRRRFALSSYDATLKRSGLPPPWLPISFGISNRAATTCHGAQRLQAPLVSKPDHLSSDLTTGNEA